MLSSGRQADCKLAGTEWQNKPRAVKTRSVALQEKTSDHCGLLCFFFLPSFRGQLIVKALTAQGRSVIATTRKESIEGLELDTESGRGNVQVRGNVDIRDVESLKRGLAGAVIRCTQ